MDWIDTGAYRVPTNGRFHLSAQDPDPKGGGLSKSQAEQLTCEGVRRLAELQNVLYADGRHGLLILLQATDAAGKDSTIKRVMSGVNPQGVKVYSFKQPSADELSHNWLWRYSSRVPERGFIGIFNRSYYEEVLVVKVRDLIGQQRLPPELLGDDLWKLRYEDINAFERHLTNNGITILKFFLNISKAEQRRRFLKRLNQPSRNWKFSSADLRERDCWNEYQKAFEKMLNKISSIHAPWYCIPMNQKRFGRLVVMKIIIEALEAMNLSYPTLTAQQRAAIDAAHQSISR
ncbi:MAG: polyphosphate kinase 2 family protein [Synechococcus sp. SB0666_bin_14]|nr:polyphosphate kinase 2 family protein [Synechococcus sp. SB0666_bin_14]MYA90412.1 polyphosphate kinase 2 family protein [Synechococcus sp. SB0663_bin_10]MYG46266.1 polyphosphate kinase 2 family protein [Synechococcus sp. SB0675_bin_6]